MGIPFYFKKVMRQFPHVLHGKAPVCARLFLDFNGIIHTCAGDLKKQTSVVIVDFESELIVAVCNYVDQLVSIICPTELVYLSIDGIPSMAKIQQQRRRRYMSALESLHSSGEKSWDTNAISPGTVFMNKLADVLRIHIQRYDIEAILSDSMDPGEGEHKIIKYMRVHPIMSTNEKEKEKEKGKGKATIIYGLDADLIMLSLLETVNSKDTEPIYLMRESQAYDMGKRSEPFLYMNVSQFRVILADHIATMYGLHCPQSIQIYVFMCFFIGNDFLPALSHLKLTDDGLEIILNAYQKVYTIIESHILTINRGIMTINTTFLWMWMDILQKTEDNAFANVHNTFVEMYRPAFYPSTHPSTSSKKSYRMTGPIIAPHMIYRDPSSKIIFGDSSWRIDYYHTLFDPTMDSPCVREACQKYIEGCQWLVDLYFHQTVHVPGWYYPYAYSPTILDLYNYLSSQIKTLPELWSSMSHNPSYKQVITDTDTLLMSILPPASLDIMPERFRSLSTDISYGILHMFPRSFPLKNYLRRLTWECYPQLPPIDVNQLQKAKQRIITKLG
jgi:5'-3' exonuclease